MIGFLPFFHTEYMIVGKTKFLVEKCYLIVSRTNLQIDFGTIHFPQSGFYRIHDFLSVLPLSLKIRMDRQIIYPPTVALITSITVAIKLLSKIPTKNSSG